MSPHKLRKTRKKRGSRTHGYGQIGQHRRAGKPKGKAGFHKHGWTYVVKHEPEYFGKKGFTSQRSLDKKPNVVNVGELEQLVEKLTTEKRLEKKKGKVFLDLTKLGYDKLLGAGNIASPLLIKVEFHSENAIKKVENAGGRILKE